MKAPIQYCRYYRGENSCPEEILRLEEGERCWFYEKCWVDMVQSKAPILEIYLKQYIQYGMASFSTYDGTPKPFKALLFDRFHHGDYISYGSPGFREWYNKYYLRAERPSPRLVEEAIASWGADEGNVLIFRSLEVLFRETYPMNTELTEVLIKVSSLNDFYATNILKTYDVAKHIQELNIDERLKKGETSLVDDIATVTLGGKTKRFYSFATKYCSFHEPEMYPICDSYVEKVLMHFRQVDHFFDFKEGDLRDYSMFISILDAFKEKYGLMRYNRKELDRFMWKYGHDHFPNRY